MELQDYLSEFFYTRAQLLAAAGVSDSVFDQWQQEGLMPQPSYVLRTTLACRSFFGEHEETTQTQYYARQYVEWLALLGRTAERHAVMTIFADRYRDTLSRLAAQGFTTASDKLTTGLDAHIDDEWGHFVAGTYGLCTRSGLPEDIAAKEIAIAIINELLSRPGNGEGDAGFRQQLTDAVNLLDVSSSYFAPHERKRSSRNRLIDQVRETYGLGSAN